MTYVSCFDAVPKKSCPSAQALHICFPAGKRPPYTTILVVPSHIFDISLSFCRVCLQMALPSSHARAKAEPPSCGTHCTISACCFRRYSGMLRRCSCLSRALHAPAEGPRCLPCFPGKHRDEVVVVRKAALRRHLTDGELRPVGQQMLGMVDTQGPHMAG